MFLNFRQRLFLVVWGNPLFYLLYVFNLRKFKRMTVLTITTLVSMSLSAHDFRRCLLLKCLEFKSVLGFNSVCLTSCPDYAPEFRHLVCGDQRVLPRPYS